MNAKAHPGMYQPPIGGRCWHTVADAAFSTGASEGTIRRAIRRAGVKKIAGPSVKGMVEISGDFHGTGYLPYYE